MMPVAEGTEDGRCPRCGKVMDDHQWFNGNAFQGGKPLEVPVCPKKLSKN